jgi:hypothetical protein
MAWYKGSQLPFIIAIICTIICLFSFFYPGTPVDAAASTLYSWVVIATSIAIVVGLINVLRIWTRETVKRTPGRWYIAVYGIVLALVMVISGLAEGSQSVSLRPGSPSSIIKWFYQNFYLYGGMAGSALSGLWMVTAAYRAFRARTVESALFLIGGVFLTLKNAPIGGVIWGGFPQIADWIQKMPYSATMKALYISMGLGIIAYALRFYLHKERVAFGVAD